MASTYAERKSAAVDAGHCLYPGCAAEPADGSDYCTAHLAAKKSTAASWIAKRRAEWDRKKLCHGCGKRRSKGARYCPACLSRGRWRYRVPVDASVENVRSDYVEVDGYARSRGHGKGKRGAMTSKEADAFDRKQADSSHRYGNDGNDRAWSDEVQQLGKVQRDDALAASDSHYALTIRSLVQILRRHKWSQDDLDALVAEPDK